MQADSAEAPSSASRLRISIGVGKVEGKSTLLPQRVPRHSQQNRPVLTELDVTESTRNLLNAFEEEQERRVASYLEDLRQNDEPEQAQEEAYSALKILRDAKLRGSTRASVSYEKGMPETTKS